MITHSTLIMGFVRLTHNLNRGFANPSIEPHGFCQLITSSISQLGFLYIYPPLYTVTHQLT